ncbi:hypothetical protein PAXRUDRAFT_836385 [Paxillus rubicundulus Ve08.2h10]|uniref:Uncharacterized protein n=1 Tax=Paxillus rubicundulus Ve08.2h10 TaxID=930991 RepID=A0A0D0BM07_9AGAM|nr:hypothetical protein PAXRUDRAFT_836385 [Paxillus rubicundulus Ve08.2h10]
MKTFLTLLATISSLSTYTLVGVHASTKCAICPSSLNGAGLYYGCSYKGNTACRYLISGTSQMIGCYYDDSKGTVTQGSNRALCPKTVNTGTGNACQCITP